GARTPATVAERVARDSHPDLTWVRPSGAAEVLVGDIEEPVVAGGGGTPVRVGAKGVRDRVGGHDERPGGEPHVEDARGAAGVRASAAADRSPRGRAGDDRLALSAGPLRLAPVGLDRGP